MTWVADTCIVIDVLENDPEFGRASAALMDKMAPEGIALCPVSYVELAPAFLGDSRRQNEFLDSIGIQYAIPWGWQDTPIRTSGLGTPYQPLPAAKSS